MKSSVHDGVHEHSKYQNSYSQYLSPSFSEDVSLDPDTAHPRLTLSEDNKSVKIGALRKGIVTKKRFEERQCVLGMEGYDTGRHYWEVDLGKKTQWGVGVTQDTENIDKNIKMHPETGYWSICLEGGALKTSEEPPTVLPIELKPEKLGVFLNCTRQKISFFNVEKQCHIHSFSVTSTKKLYPLFGPFHGCKEELKISPVTQETNPSSSEKW